MSGVYISGAASGSTGTRRAFCLLKSREAFAAYECLEVAQKLGADKEAQRIEAYWQHYATHVEAYVRWARRKRYFDVTFQDGPASVDDLVCDVLVRFKNVVNRGTYDPGRGLPCTYNRRSIKNRWVDIVRRGRHPSEADCRRCLALADVCKFTGEKPSRRAREKQCHQIPEYADFDEICRTFAAAGLLGENGISVRTGNIPQTDLRPAEESAIQKETLKEIWDVANQVLRPVAVTVLRLTYWEDMTSREIAHRVGHSPNNVDQIRRRALQRLRKLLDR